MRHFQQRQLQIGSLPVKEVPLFAYHGKDFNLKKVVEKKHVDLSVMLRKADQNKNGLNQKSYPKVMANKKQNLVLNEIHNASWTHFG